MAPGGPASCNAFQDRILPFGKAGRMAPHCEGCGREIDPRRAPPRFCDSCLAGLGIEDDVAKEVGLKDDVPPGEEEMGDRPPA